MVYYVIQYIKLSPVGLFPAAALMHDVEDDVHFGFDAFYDYLKRCQPSYFIHGHQHKNAETVVGNTRIIGVFGYRYVEIE